MALEGAALACPCLFAVQKVVRAVQVNIGTRPQHTPLGTDEHILHIGKERERMGRGKSREGMEGRGNDHAAGTSKSHVSPPL